MKHLTAAVVLLLTTTTYALAQPSAGGDANRPPQSGTTLAPAQPTSPTGQAGMRSQGTMGMPTMMSMMGGNMPMGMATIDRVEGRIAFLRTELRITDAQANAWNAFADSLRANAKKLGEVRASMMAQPGSAQQAPTAVDRLELQERWLAARLEGTRAIKTAVTSLYGVLTDDQKRTANELLAPHMGMTSMMSGMPPGAMGPGQMGHGRMGPDQMRPGPMMPGQMYR